MTKLYSSGAAQRPMLKWFFRFLTIFVSVPLGMVMTGGSFYMLAMIPLKNNTLAGWLIILPFLLLMAWGAIFCSILIVGGSWNLSFKRGAELYDVLEDRVAVTLPNKSELVIPFADISTFYLRTALGTNASLTQYLRTLMKRIQGNYAMMLAIALPWRVLFLEARKDRANGVTFGVVGKEGMIVVIRKGGISVYKRLLKPWLWLQPAKNNDLVFTPTHPREFYEQFSLAFEKWRKRSLGFRARPHHTTGGEPLFTITPQYIFSSYAASVLPLLLYFGGIGILMVYGLFTDPPARTLIFIWLVLLAAVINGMTIGFLFSLTGFRKHINATTYRFYADRIEYEIGFPGAIPGRIAYDDILEVNHMAGFPKSLFGLGVVEKPNDKK